LSASALEKALRRSWYIVGSFAAGSTYSLGDRAFSISRIVIAKTSTFFLLIRAAKGAAPIMQRSRGLDLEIPKGKNSSGMLVIPETCTGKCLGAIQEWQQWSELKVTVLRSQSILGL
jgi:hypothetical protein